MTSNFTAAELRELADKLRLPLRNQDHVKTEDDASDALREYATLIDTVLDGGDVVTMKIAEDMYAEFLSVVSGERRDPRIGIYRALTAALPAIRLRLLADTAKEGK